ncbi:MAG: type I-MYXAN CRISPR-associated protein Cas5/Cmx5/DevS [Planctomycetes bacterium]|nr:type I-MYXAN CRISPR-associated protein Cas5/Cmx5/DevS [Planctomycetota bacterium]
MLGVHVTVPVACFRKGMAREYLETEPIPPPATCYGFLLSLVGETDRRRHIGCRVTVTRIGRPDMSVVLRTVWRIKKTPLGSSGNTRPDYQQLLTEINLVVWLDSSDEVAGNDRTLEERVRDALERPASVHRFGGLSLGESTHLINEVSILDAPERLSVGDSPVDTFVQHKRSRMTLPVWVDHVGSAGTRYATGNLESAQILRVPELATMPQISPESSPDS